MSRGVKRDLTALRREYEEGVTLPRLSAKYDIPLSTLKKRCALENWTQSRNLRKLEQYTRALEEGAASDAPAVAWSEQGQERVRRLVDKLLDRLEQSVDAMQEGDTQTLRQLTGALRDLRQLTDSRDALDREEQLARIEKLRAETRGHAQDSREVTVCFVDTEGGEE